MDLAVVQQRNIIDSDGTEIIGSLPAAPGSRLQFSWGTGTQLRLCEVHSQATGAGGEDPYAGFVEWIPPVGEQRRTAYDIMPLYKNLRKKLHMLGSGRQQEAREALQEYSASVLNVLTSCASDPAAGPPRSEDLLQVAYEAGLWQLLELFFLSSDTPEGFFAEAFAAWLCQHGGLLCMPSGFHLLAAEARRLQQLQRVDDDPGYWPALQRLVLTGQIEVALTLLTAHPAYAELTNPDMAAKVEVLEQVFRLLRLVPRFSRQAGSSSSMLGAGGTLTDDIVVFSAERAKWTQQVDELYARRAQLLADMKKLDPAAAKGLAGILCLLCAGSSNEHIMRDSFNHAKSIAHNWVELLAGVLLWKYPTLQPQLHLKHLVNKVKTALGGASRHSDEEFLDFFEQLLLAACDQEVQTIITLATQQPYCGLQFIAHIYDVIRASPGAERVISRPLPGFGGDQAEMFTLHYVETLTGHATTWQLAAEYLAWCPVHGSAVLEALLDRSPFPLQDEVTALKAFALAQRHGLTGAAAGLARRLGMAAAAGGRSAAALQWFMRAHDPARCAELVAPLLAKVQQQLLDQAGSYQAAPLDLPELSALEPLLAHLPAQSSSKIGFVQQQHQQQLLQARPYQELHCLRALLRLQEALQGVQRCQQPVAAAGAPVSAQQQAALSAAYRDVRGPVVELLLEGLAPAAMQLPLLLYLVPVFDSAHMPFSRGEVQGLLQVLGGASAGALPAAAAAVLAGRHSTVAGLALPAVAGSGSAGSNGKLHARHVDDVRLVLCRSLVKAHVQQAAALVDA